MDAGNDQRIARGGGPHGRDEAAISRARPGHAAARFDRGQDRLRQVHAVSCIDHQPGAVVQPGAGGVLPGGLQEGDRLDREKKTVDAMLKKWPEYIKPNPSRKSKFPELRLIRQTRKNKGK